MSDTGDNVTDEAKREEAREEEEERQKQKEKEEQREREEKERKQKEEKERKQKEEKERKDKEEKDRKDKEEKDRKDKEEKDREQKQNEQKDTEREYDTVSEEGKAKQREFFKAELMRLEKSLKDESSKIVRPKVKNYSPFVFTTLEPYYNTYVPNFLIDLCDERGFQKNAEDPRPGYVSRNTAIGLCDPWMDLRMDRELLPRLSTPASKSRKKTAGGKKRKDKKERPPKEGSTRLPKFPVVDFNTNKENATKQFLYSEVPRFRQEMAGRYSQTAPKKIEVDYTRTRQDFYRMNLDRLDEIHPVNRPHMRQAYFAYLQNTPGSKKAVKECVKGLEKDPQAQQAH